MDTNGHITHTVLFKEKDRKAFLDIKSGIKKYEVRAYKPEYEKIQKGDTVVFMVDSEKKDIFATSICSVTHHASTSEMLQIYEYSQLSKDAQSEEEYTAYLESFPDYPNRIKKGGLFVFELGEIETL